MNYTGKIIVRNSEGIRVDHDWGGFNKLLCDDTTNDPNFTFGEMRYNPGGLRGPVQGHEAFHCLRGRGVLRVFCAGGIEGDPISIPLNPGSEFYVRGDVPRTIESSETPLTPTPRTSTAPSQPHSSAVRSRARTPARHLSMASPGAGLGLTGR